MEQLRNEYERVRQIVSRCATPLHGRTVSAAMGRVACEVLGLVWASLPAAGNGMRYPARATLNKALRTRLN